MNGSRNGCFGNVALADRASGVQAVDDRVAPALLLRGIIRLRTDIVAAWAKRPKFENGCP